MTGLNEALARNQAFAAERRFEGTTVFPNLQLMVIACLDPRTDPAHVLGIDLGDAMVIRNAGGRVTDEVIADVAFIERLATLMTPDGPPLDVAVIHHTQCGTAFLADPDLAGDLGHATGITAATLTARAVTNPRHTALHDADRLRQHPATGDRLRIHALVHDVETGNVQILG